MNNIINDNLKKRLNALLLKYGLSLPSGMEICFNQFVMFKATSGKFSGSDCWLYVSDKEMIIEFFGNIQHGENYSFTITPIAKGDERKWFSLYRERLYVRELREQRQGNYTGVTRGHQAWITSSENNYVNP